MSFLEMLDVLNEKLINDNEEPIAFEHDCREGICGSCSMMINGEPHGPLKGTTVCQLHMFHFNNGDIIIVEPWRANSFPIVKDLVVDRSAFDRIIQSGGYVSVNTGSAPDGNAIPISREDAAEAFDSAACIGCGLVWLFVKIVQQVYLYLQKFLNCQYCHKGHLKKKSV